MSQPLWNMLNGLCLGHMLPPLPRPNLAHTGCAYVTYSSKLLVIGTPPPNKPYDQRLGEG